MNQQNYTTEIPATSFRRRKKITQGVIFILVGLVVLLHQMPSTTHLIPDWLYGSHMILIIIGIYSGIKHNFANVSWIILILIGIYMAIQKYSLVAQESLLLYGLPVALIVVGVVIMIKRNNR